MEDYNQGPGGTLNRPRVFFNFEPMTEKEKILNKHFEKEYGFALTKEQMPKMKYILDAMGEYAVLRSGKGPQDE